ncbi:uncharacterized protein LOC123447614 [Hordeum vulgare subsp. vulgare]|uniref:uncharacterized protein LOC123447614 n=1 Tax=Hordeum vulgare subsp. vulgare TaxID=112509 RepID=UPI001D1A4B19|nr:uncharacterized protein LOC123447614 [Hordeum vulgare subsp. vulgare]
MSSPPPSLHTEEAPRPHAAPTAGASAAGHVGGADANRTASGGREVQATICPACMVPWSSDGPHRICCIPCGHVYGRSCLENLLHRSGEESAKCPQCGKGFAEKLIINLYAPENMLEGCCSPEEIRAFYEPIFAAVIRVHSEYNVAEEPSSDSTCDEMHQLFTERVAQIEGTVNEKVTMAKANLMLMKEGLKKMAEQEKMVPKDVIEFLEQNCPRLMIPVSCLFPSSPTPGMGDVEIADVEIVVREGPYNPAMEDDEQGDIGNDVNHTTLVSGEVTNGSYRREVEEVDSKCFGDSSYSVNYNVDDSNKEANGMFLSMNMEAAAEGVECVETKPAAGPTCSICMEPWTSTGEHHICCIPCGHVYGWSCLIRWVKYQLSGNESVKCPQCGEGFEDRPIDLHAPFCQEVHAYYESKFAEIGASIEDCTVYAKMTSHLEELSVDTDLRDAELRALLDCHFTEMERLMTAHVALANVRLMSMKEQMKKMAEEDKATTEDLVGFMELYCHQLFPTLPSLPPCPF